MEKLKLMTAEELENKNLPPQNWALENLLPEGLTILAGAPKSGKSLLAFGISLALSSGTEIIGKKNESIKNVLYLPYEDSERSLQDKIKKIRNGLSIEKNKRTYFFDNNNIPKIESDNLEWLKNLVKENQLDVIIVDTLGSALRNVKRKGLSTYLDEYALLNSFQKFAKDNKICLILLHHTRKMKAENVFDEISGTRAIAGSADANLILQRNKLTGLLQIQGRELKDASYDLELDEHTLLWRFKGTSNSFGLSPEQQSILDAYEKDYEKEFKPSEIAKLIGKENDQNVRASFRKLNSLGLLNQDSYGKYKLAQIN